MVDPELQDLLPLYLTEGRRRLERLLELVPRLGDPESIAGVRRELHTLKGSSRMLKLSTLAELCHRGETLLQEPAADTADALTEILDELGSGLDQLEASSMPAASPGAPDDFSPGGRTSLEASAPVQEPSGAEPGGAHEHRLSMDAADRLISTMASMRLLALAGLNTGQRLGELAQLAESGVTESLPRQVLAMLATHLRQVSQELESQERRQLRHAEEYLGRLLDLQLQPLRPFLQGLARHARELARELGKEIDVEIEGGEAKLDQRIVTELRGAFLHLVANAVDHGFEDPATRRGAGKPERGALRLVATSFGDRVEIVVADDGAGIDPARVLAAAREADLVRGDAPALSPEEVLQLVFTTGFSTRHEVSEVSGRGVGLDAVAATVRQLGGDVWLDSEPGRGTSIFVEVPAARRGERVLVLRVGDERIALPKSAVRLIHRPRPDEILEGGGGPTIELEGSAWRIVSLAGLTGAELTDVGLEGILVALEVGGHRRMLAAESVVKEEEVLVRPFGRRIRVPDVYLGTALLTSGEPVAVLSPRALVGRLAVTRPAPRAKTPERLRVLLVEDSLVTREMERRMLEEEGFRVTATPGAEEALRRLAEETYDCLVTDLEMPEMDGFELTRRVRGTRKLSQLPIVVVSTLSSAEDRLAGLEAGADAFISKQTIEARSLGRLIRRLGRGR